ncbi:MAG: 4Fe-4S binding protein [Verrucomicrobia bacterium]|nr:4Fe-4S binding protein [Verrucomicrobiota bacterium]MCF7708363.1 4Fe-4S binding protein [Verrucomicrobiota bacterium]
MNIFVKTLRGLKGLLSGMGLTFGYFARPSKVITQQYPENRNTLKLPERSQARIDLIKNAETGRYNCIACGLCVKACPNNSIELTKFKDPETKKFRPEKFVYHFERCLVCGLCVEACKFDALRMTSEFETAAWSPDDLVEILNKDDPWAHDDKSDIGQQTAPDKNEQTASPARDTDRQEHTGAEEKTIQPKDRSPK